MEEAAIQEQTAKKPKAKRPTKKAKAVLASARRKTARARATLVAGNGKIYINGKEIGSISNKYLRDLVLEPVNLSPVAKGVASSSTIRVNVYGGGMSGQMQAARSAIAKVLVMASKSDSLKKLYLNYDRALLVDDTRQVEPKKFKGPKARARFQKSYR